MNGSEIFPLINASLNSLALLTLIFGFVLVKRKNFEAHKKVMLGAFSISALFLVSYLYYHYNYPARPFQGTGFIRPIYFTILISHIILAVGVLPFILRLLWVAFNGNFQTHKRLARWVYPIWVYNSATGILVYLFLYQWFPGDLK